MLELLFALAFWPWVLTIALFCVLIVSAWKEAVSFGVFALAIYLAIAFFAYGTNPIAWVGNNPGSAIVAGGTYMSAGALWSLFKWDRWMASARVRDAIKAAKKEYDKKTEAHEEFFASYLFPSSARPSDNKERITTWLALWPFSVTGYFIGEILLRLFERIYDALSGLYVSITKRHIG